MAKKTEWHRAVPRYQLDEGFLKLNEVTTITVEGKKLCLGHLEDGYFAVDDKCPHAGGSLGSGWCDNQGNVICPYHRIAYRLRDGLPATGRGYYVNSYPVELREDGLYVGFKKRGWW